MVLTIGAVAAQLGIAPSTIRYYEAQGLIPQAIRRHGQRTYLQADVDIIRLVLTGRMLGLSIAELSTLKQVSAAPADLRKHVPDLLRDMLARTDAQIERLAAQRDVLSNALTCNCSNPARCNVLA